MQTQHVVQMQGGISDMESSLQAVRFGLSMTDRVPVQFFDKFDV